MSKYEASGTQATDAFLYTVETSEEAEEIRSKVLKSKYKAIIYVIRRGTSNGYHIYISNEFGGVPSDELYEAIRAEVGEVKEFTPQETVAN